MTEKAAPEPVAWLIRWTERDTPCSMIVDFEPDPADAVAEGETITPLYAHPPAERVAVLKADLAKMREERDAALPDAERYRWMKREVKRIPPGWEMIGWDAAIDAARKEGDK